ncbi:uncharacterized protein LOC131958228 [Physella acuta]|uniref:uncharacterized protein LOC131958228 n=1 Tax=Physella acuta TaxID=109671 RepID=UPI0027DBC06E|nr:uncharacterized protein LOC131958228 [Physella acuta]
MATIQQLSKSADTIELTEALVLTRTRSQDLESVRKLNCWASNVGDVSVVRRLPNLEVCSLSINKITTLRDFAHCYNLQELYVRTNNIQRLSDIHYLKNLKKLRSLWLSENPCANEENYRMTVLKTLPTLQKLDNIVVTEEEVLAAATEGDDLPVPDDFSYSSVFDSVTQEEDNKDVSVSQSSERWASARRKRQQKKREDDLKERLRLSSEDSRSSGKSEEDCGKSEEDCGNLKSSNEWVKEPEDVSPQSEDDVSKDVGDEKSNGDGVKDKALNDSTTTWSLNLGELKGLPVENRSSTDEVDDVCKGGEDNNGLEETKNGGLVENEDGGLEDNNNTEISCFESNVLCAGILKDLCDGLHCDSNCVDSVNVNKTVVCSQDSLSPESVLEHKHETKEENLEVLEHTENKREVFSDNLDSDTFGSNLNNSASNAVVSKQPLLDKIRLDDSLMMAESVDYVRSSVDQLELQDISQEISSTVVSSSRADHPEHSLKSKLQTKESKDPVNWEEYNRLRVEFGMKPVEKITPTVRPVSADVARARNSNILQAVLSLVKELDKDSLDIVAGVVKARLDCF